MSDFLSEEKRLMLARALGRAGHGNGLRIPRRSQGGPAPLSFAQQRIWFLQQLAPDSPQYNTPVGVSLRGSLHIPTLKKTLGEIVRRHETFRTIFPVRDGEPSQVCLPPFEPQLPLKDLSGLAPSEREAQGQMLMEEEAARPFRLDEEPPVRFLLLRLDEEEHWLSLVTHHMVFDTWSVGIFGRELTAIYAAFVEGRPSPLQELPIQYADFSLWQREQFEGEEAQRQLDYWIKKLEGAPQLLMLPADYQRPPVQRFRGRIETFAFSRSLTDSLNQLCRSEGATLFMVLMAAFQTLLYRYSSEEEIVVGTATGNRNRREIEGLIGCFINTLLFRTSFRGDPPFREVLRQVRQLSLEASSNQNVPFEKIVSALHPKRDLSYSPLTQAMLILQNTEISAPTPEGLKIRRLSLPDRVAAQYDLVINLRETDAGLRGMLEYSTELFEPATARRILGHFETILHSIAAQPDRQVSALELVTERERAELLSGFNQTRVEFPRRERLPRLIERQAQERGESIALSHQATQLSYRELNERANRLARYLMRQGLRAEARVGVLMERGAEAVVALLGVMKAGGAYVPLDPTYPKDRLLFMIEDSQAEILLTRKAYADSLADARARVVCLDAEREAMDDCPPTDPRVDVSPDNLAYIIYTSGSTGRPKGVMLAHRGVVNNLLWRQKQWPLGPSDRVLQSYSFSFDPSVWATFWPLLAGASVVIPRAEANLDSVALARLMAEERITVFGAAPSIHSILADEPAFQSCDSLRYIFSGGELLEGQLQQQLQWLPGAELYNVYGPTEATIDCTYWHCPRVPDPSPAPIGRPIANTDIHIVNRHLRLSPVGAPGEICIRSVGLARGYVGAPELTAEKFVPDPFSEIPGSRMYRTGDMGRLSSDGTLEFIGRVDDQVKVRGFRIELSEIERNLARHEGVREAAVIVKRNSAADARLIAYYAPVSSIDAPSQSELAEFLAERLPHYMVPDLFAALEALPRTPTGKVDKNSLPAVEEGDKRGGREYRPPRDQLETEISQIIGGVLGVERLSIDDDIFDLGSNSLLIARIASRLSSAYQIDLPVQQIFKDPTVAGIAALVDIYRREGNQGAITSWTIEQVESEAELSPEITAQGLPPFEFRTPRNIFLTGATGYLGAFILERLLRTGPAECFCLVRASSPEQGLERIRESMKGYRIWDDSFAARIHPVVGDIARPELGIGSEEFARLASEIDTIYHCGALVNFIYPYSALRGPNVFGTHEVLRLATREKLKPVHYTSTVDVLLGTHMKRPFYETDEVLHHPNEIPDGYGRSKLVAEKMLSNAMSRGVPVVVYRPGLIMGHTATGATQTNDYLLVGLKGYIDLGMLAEPSIMIDFVTVDFVAAALVYLSMQPESIGRYFHIWNPWPVHMSRAYEWINSFGYQLKVVPGNVLRDKVLKEVDVSNVLYPFLPLFRAMRDNPPISSHDPRIMEKINLLEECRNTLEGLRGSGIECPRLDEQLAHLCLSYLVSIGFLPEPVAYAQNHA